MRRLALLCAALLALACAERGAPEHALLISVDTLRADRLGVYGHARARTPHIDALASESIRFERAYAHSSMTLPSLASLLSGRLPKDHHIYSNGGVLEHGATLAEHLRAAGFETAAFIGSYALRPNRGFDRGFDRYTKRFRDREENRPQPENRARFLTDEAIAWLDDRHPQRFFVWIHYQEPHGPYTPAEFEPPSASQPELPRSRDHTGRGAIPAYQWLGHGRLPEYEARYDGEIAEVDRQLGRLIAALRERGLYERTAIVFTADHGEAFGEQGLYCAHGEGLGEALLRVPLLLRAPALAPAVRSDRVRQIDIAPTLLALLGAPDPTLPGRSLLEDLGDRTLVAQLVRRDTGWRSIRRGDAERSEESGPGAAPATPPRPGETPDPELAAELERLAPWPEGGPAPRLDPEERAALRAMGYAD